MQQDAQQTKEMAAKLVDRPLFKTPVSSLFRRSEVKPVTEKVYNVPNYVSLFFLFVSYTTTAGSSFFPSSLSSV